MKQWPLKNIDPQCIPSDGHPGSFWEDRGDRFHCGVDLYAPEGSEVGSIEDGTVIEVGMMTSLDILAYWNTTYYIIIKNDSGLSCKYGELSRSLVQKGDEVRSGQLIAYVGTVLDSSKIDFSSPLYIQKLKNKNPSMLHMEIWKDDPITSHDDYLGGNWFTQERPEDLVDPTAYLYSITGSFGND